MYTPVIICTLDRLPYEISPLFKILVNEVGLKAAVQWTEEIDVPLSKEPDG